MNRSARTAWVALFLLLAGPAGAEPDMGDYFSTPPYMTITPTPNVMILFDNSGSMYFFAYDFDGGNVSTGFDPNTEYSGYFDPGAWHSYQSANNRFVVAGYKADRSKASSEWDGNFLNWLTMRRIDIARQVLVGGKCVSRYAATPNYDLLGEKGDFTSRGYLKRVSSANLYTPYSGTRCFTFEIGASGASRFLTGTSSTGSCASFSSSGSFTVRVHQPDEPTGLIQQVGDKVRWGLGVYNLPEWSPLRVHGGRVAVNVADDSISQMVTTIENEARNTATPLAESLWTLTGYFARNSTTGSTGPRYYSDNARSYSTAAGADPYYFDTLGRHVECAKSFVIVLTDGEPTHDRDIPASIKGYAPSYTDGSAPVPAWAGPDPPNYFWVDTGTNPQYGSHYLDDVALWARVDPANQRYRDLRTDLAGDQYLTSYFVWASFGDATPDGRRLLMQAARAGTFVDRDGDFLPNLCCEYRREGDCVAVADIEDCPPDAYFEADSGTELSVALNQVMSDILRRTASGTALAQISTRASGEGALYQAYFNPVEMSFLGGHGLETTWLGYLQSFWVDGKGRIREDNGDLVLDYDQDPVIEFYFDPDEGTLARRSYDGGATWSDEGIPLKNLRPLWEAGNKLALRTGDRNIYATLDGATRNPFTPGASADFADLLGVSAAQAADLMRFIAGEDLSGFRSRQIYVDTNGDNVPDSQVTWRLGDIINSTPRVVAQPTERYDTRYGDPTYREFHRAKTSRSTVVYVGANNGMLHAFNAGVFNAREKRFDNPMAPVELGGELWAYIPLNVLPFLRFLADPDYTHVYYVDAKPKITDARIFSAGTAHPQGWGTVLIGGLGLGGMTRDGAVHGDFRSSFFAIDITNPGTQPEFMWEWSDPDLGFTTCYPVITRHGGASPWDEKGEWRVALGSGPTTHAGDSDQSARIYVLDLDSGQERGRLASEKSNGFIGGMMSYDLEDDYNVNAIYAGESYRDGAAAWKGRVGRVYVGKAPSPAGYGPPADWTLSTLVNTKSGQAVVAPTDLARDPRYGPYQPWIFWGTGRFFCPVEDKDNSVVQSFYGVRDRTLASAGPAENLSAGDLVDVSDVQIRYEADGNEVTGSSLGTTWKGFREAMFAETGWFFDLDHVAPGKAVLGRGERVLEAPVVFRDLVIFTTYRPDEDICAFGGRGALYVLHYTTGTAAQGRGGYGVFNTEPPPDGTNLPRGIELGEGKPSGPSVHVTEEGDVQIIVQMSTSVVVTIHPDIGVKDEGVVWYEE